MGRRGAETAGVAAQNGPFPRPHRPERLQLRPSHRPVWPVRGRIRDRLGAEAAGLLRYGQGRIGRFGPAEPADSAFE